MYFRTKNFSIRDFSREKFEQIADIEQPVLKLSSSDIGVAVSQGSSVMLVDAVSGDVRRMTKFDGCVTALDAQGDVVACGDEKGNIRIVGSRKRVIRRYAEHETEIKDLKINGTTVVSCSSDMKIKIFDISEPDSVGTIFENSDYVTSVSMGDGFLFSGSYDRNVCGYCMKTFCRVFTHVAKGPVSLVCYLETGELAYSCGNEVFVINTKNSDVHVRTKPIHSKKITRMMYYEKRLYTASLDASLRVLTRELQLISKIYVRCGILDFDIWKDVVYFGLEDGCVLRLVKDVPREEDRVDFVEKTIGLYDEMAFDTLQVSWRRHDVLERCLNRFEYKKSMMDAVNKRDLQKIFAVMTFIHEKQKFEHALMDLDRRALCRVIDVVTEFFNSKELIPVFGDCIETILNLYERDMFDDDELLEKIEALSSVVDDEVSFQEKNLRMISFLECFKNRST